MGKITKILIGTFSAAILIASIAIGRMAGSGLIDKLTDRIMQSKVTNEISKDLPIMVDSITRLDEATMDSNNNYNYTYTLIEERGQNSSEKIISELRPIVTERSCTTPEVSSMIESGSKYTYRYRTANLSYIGEISVARNDCHPIKNSISSARHLTDDQWRDLMRQAVSNVAWKTQEPPFIFYLPESNTIDFNERYRRTAMSISETAQRGVKPGNVIAFGSPANSHMADILVDTFRNSPSNTMAGVQIIFIGPNIDNNRVHFALSKSGATYEFIDIETATRMH